MSNGAYAARSIFLLLVVLLTGCGVPGTIVRYAPEEMEVVGVHEALNRSKLVDIVLVHGMCYHDSRWVDETNDHLAAALRLTRSRSANSSQSIGRFGGLLYSNELTGPQGERVRTFAILWSPVVAATRAKLCYDTSANTDSCPATAAHLQDQRAAINGLLKNQIMDGCLSDAIYAVGQEGVERLGSTIEEGLSIALAGGARLPSQAEATLAPLQRETAPLFVVTESLGSKLFIDAAIRMANRSCEARESIALAMKRTIQIFMQANQLPILTLAYDPSLSSDCAGALEARPALSPTNARSLDALVELRRASTTGREAVPATPLKIVGFSDANDLLSYTLVPAPALPTGLAVADVVLVNDWSWLGIVENPYTAHTTYGTKCLVNNVIAYGTAGLSMSCPSFR